MAGVQLLVGPLARPIFDCHLRTCCPHSFRYSVSRGPTAIRSLKYNISIETYRGILPQTILKDAAALLSDAFSDEGGIDMSPDEDSGAASGPAQLAYQIRLMAALQYRGLTEGRQFIVVIARARRSTDIDDNFISAGGGELAGIATMAPGASPLPDAAAHFCNNDRLAGGETLGSLSNMAVGRLWRRQGIGRKLLAAAEEATGAWPVPPLVFALCVYINNEPAVRLYKSAGYVVDDSWTDPRWLNEAERGKVGRQRRLLMVKKVESWEEER